MSKSSTSPKDRIFRQCFLEGHIYYTPGIYAEGYIVFVFPFVCAYVGLFVHSFLLISVAWNLPQSFALKFLKWCISQQLLIRKHSVLDHSYTGGLAFTPWPRTPGSMPWDGARGQKLGHP